VLAQRSGRQNLDGRFRVSRQSALGTIFPHSTDDPRAAGAWSSSNRAWKNKEIADELEIRPGTVKIHLKHIFEKTGIRGRYGLALNGLKERGLVSVPA